MVIVATTSFRVLPPGAGSGLRLDYNTELGEKGRYDLQTVLEGEWETEDRLN